MENCLSFKKGKKFHMKLYNINMLIIMKQKVLQVYTELESKVLVANMEDALQCKPNKRGIFSVKLCYNISNTAKNEGMVQPSGKIIPPRVSFFAWEVWRGEVKLQIIYRKGTQMTNCCYLCLEEESTKCLLVHCCKTQQLWHLDFCIVWSSMGARAVN